MNRMFVLGEGCVAAAVLTLAGCQTTGAPMGGFGSQPRSTMNSATNSPVKNTIVPAGPAAGNSMTGNSVTGNSVTGVTGNSVTGTPSSSPLAGPAVTGTPSGNPFGPAGANSLGNSGPSAGLDSSPRNSNFGQRPVNPYAPGVTPASSYTSNPPSNPLPVAGVGGPLPANGFPSAPATSPTPPPMPGTTVSPNGVANPPSLYDTPPPVTPTPPGLGVPGSR